MKNVILIGFMGTGKTSTGKMLANKLGIAFIDMDQKIEEEAGMTINDMFAKHGEAYFRTKEHEMACRLGERQNAVISTGGGTVKNPANMEALRKSGVIVCLSARADVVLDRTSCRGTRPVLDKEDQGDRLQAIEKLMAERKSLYAQADFTVDTSELSPLLVVDEIVRFLKVRGVIHA